ncbi:sulfite exporter TauE/SafE family protein [Pseudonocardia oroxyli]|uniref:sulfite exporter TauE/SafE family protein n=1 Tax=Pseudonocardia oroxyli TaxID=366584 RepID=UPI001FE06550|nr:sulfite exporter TauE/SafE family protein [Pseudonocardia oroxyli]
MNPLEAGLSALAAGFVVAIVTTPVGVSGAVFLLPIHLDVLGVPSPAVTPTNLLFNVVATPGALVRHHRTGSLGGPLTSRLLVGTVPGVIVGSVLRVYATPGEAVFRILAACLLGPLGLWLVLRRPRPPAPETTAGPARATITALGFVVGVVGGIYGIGGGSLLGPVLVGLGLPLAAVAPAALASTFVTSVAGVATYGVLSLVSTGPVAPEWAIGILCGVGGLLGGYLGARLQPRVPEKALRILLGLLAVGLAAAYLVAALT